LIGGMAGTAAAMASLLAVVVWMDNRTIREEIVELRAQREAAVADAREADFRLREAEQALEAQRGEARALEVGVKRLREAGEAGANGSGERKAVRARVFVGNQAVGEAWVLQGGGTNRLGVLAEPVVVLNQSVMPTLSALTARNAEASAPVREVTVNHNYADSTPWTTWWPATWVVSTPEGTNCPPSGGGGGVNPPSSPVRPPLVENRGIWRPTEKPFLPQPSPWPIVTPPRGRQVVSPFNGQSGAGGAVIRRSVPVQRAVGPAAPVVRSAPAPVGGGTVATRLAR